MLFMQLIDIFDTVHTVDTFHTLLKDRHKKSLNTQALFSVVLLINSSVIISKLLFIITC